MTDIWSKIEGMLDEAVTTALHEESNERGLQLKTAEKITKDKRPLRAGENGGAVDEAEDDDTVAKQNDDKGEAGGDMSRRKVEIPAELPGVITLDMIVQGIDSLRSARSLKDPNVYADLEEYWEGLSSPEKVALLAFINGLAETLIGGEGDRSRDPSDPPYNVEMASDPVQHDKTSTLKSRQPKDPSASTGASDTPIVVGGQ
jgi:hypothetical protein